MGEKVGKKLGEKMGEKTGEKVGESLGEIHKLKLCRAIESQCPYKVGASIHWCPGGWAFKLFLADAILSWNSRFHPHDL